MEINPGKNGIPVTDKIKAARAKVHENHVEFMYGHHWAIYIDHDHSHYLELDVGHFCSKFISVKITEEDYESMKNDLSTYKDISKKVMRGLQRDVNES